MGTKAKLSKFEEAAILLLEEGEDIGKQAERAYRKAVSKVSTQIAQLDGKKVDYEDKIEDAQEDVKLRKFSLEFDLASYDEAVSKLECLQDELKAIESTIDNRKTLLDSWK